MGYKPGCLVVSVIRSALDGADISITCKTMGHLGTALWARGIPTPLSNAVIIHRPDQVQIEEDTCLCPLNVEATAASAGYSIEVDEEDECHLYFIRKPLN